MSETRERPILMSGPMVQAILDGRKTQTRRVVKPVPPPDSHWDDAAKLFAIDGSSLGVMRSCPYGWTGDRLWVKEGYSRCVCDACEKAWPKEGKPGHGVTYRADGERADWVYQSPIFMPRWASRLTLEITEVRVQRVAKISEADAMAEGAAPMLVPPDGGSAPHVEGFRALWDSLNAKRGYGWATNCWVWAISFRAVSGAPARGDL